MCDTSLETEPLNPPKVFLWDGEALIPVDTEAPLGSRAISLSRELTAIQEELAVASKHLNAAKDATSYGLAHNRLPLRQTEVEMERYGAKVGALQARMDHARRSVEEPTCPASRSCSWAERTSHVQDAAECQWARRRLSGCHQQTW
ncbi:MAG: uncharacterized protein KVP18_000720 [Porospora cf. gigantea A]|uniref:uncharacterized protein n=1 Tax=Porospora cf. gigantea A TaxID=2853593 RepID=UPI003559834E|nr:MAG: hypothetical protein KVP18_000720 [Porospora cf. gigantea A]